MIVRIATFLMIATLISGCSRPPDPESELGKNIHALMVEFEVTPGPIDLTSKLCGALDEVALQALVEEMPELRPTLNLIGRDPVAPVGSTAVGFSRPVGWWPESWWQSQHMSVLVKSNVNFCKVTLVRRSW